MSSHGKDAIALVLDIGTGMDGKPIELAKKFLRELISHKFVDAGQHQVSFIVFGSDNSVNALYEEGMMTMPVEMVMVLFVFALISSFMVILMCWS